MGPISHTHVQKEILTKLKHHNDECNDVPGIDAAINRRNTFKRLLLLTVSTTLSHNKASLAVDDDLTRGGVNLSPFNGLSFNYRGNDKNGLDASTIDEPSIPYVDFLKKLDEGDVEFVEFLAPNGDAAYATFKVKDGEKMMKPIRIGEGYPIEDPEGWSSPAFVIKSVKKKGVAYKFIVPMLDKYR
mmetsp:Transcript_22752/g.27903  ORF Transcript_22752/g.27903 Transcript_22752/m.27903 type:complete len:186 (-) Transcript_22752:3421-3978(-)